MLSPSTACTKSPYFREATCFSRWLCVKKKSLHSLKLFCLLELLLRVCPILEEIKINNGSDTPYNCLQSPESQTVPWHNTIKSDILRIYLIFLKIFGDVMMYQTSSEIIPYNNINNNEQFLYTGVWFDKSFLWSTGQSPLNLLDDLQTLHIPTNKKLDAWTQYRLLISFLGGYFSSFKKTLMQKKICKIS